MNKFCCNKFEFRVKLRREASLNIRIIKLNEESPFYSRRNKYRFFISEGYKENETGVAVSNISYCPYCRTNLQKFYRNDEYVNEFNHSFLFPKTDIG